MTPDSAFPWLAPDVQDHLAAALQRFPSVGELLSIQVRLQTPDAIRWPEARDIAYQVLGSSHPLTRSLDRWLRDDQPAQRLSRQRASAARAPEGPSESFGLMLEDLQQAPPPPVRDKARHLLPNLPALETLPAGGLPAATPEVVGLPPLAPIAPTADQQQAPLSPRPSDRPDALVGPSAPDPAPLPAAQALAPEALHDDSADDEAAWIDLTPLTPLAPLETLLAPTPDAPPALAAAPEVVPPSGPAPDLLGVTPLPLDEAPPTDPALSPEAPRLVASSAPDPAPPPAADVASPTASLPAPPRPAGGAARLRSLQHRLDALRTNPTGG